MQVFRHLLKFSSLRGEDPNLSAFFAVTRPVARISWHFGQFSDELRSRWEDPNLSAFLLRTKADIFRRVYVRSYGLPMITMNENDLGDRQPGNHRSTRLSRFLRTSQAAKVEKIWKHNRPVGAMQRYCFGKKPLNRNTPVGVTNGENGLPYHESQLRSRS